MKLRPYQREAIDAVHARFAECDSTLAVMATGLGKAQPNCTPTLTPTGWVAMSRLRVGSQVVGSDGSPCRVTGVFHRGRLATYTVTTSDGAMTTCCADHLWAVQTKSQKCRGSGWVVKPLCELMGDLCDGSGAAKWFLPIVKPIRFQASPLPMHPYLLGVLIGDGTFVHNLAFSTADQGIVDAVSRITEGIATVKSIGSYDYRLHVGRVGRKGSVFGRALRNLGLWGLHSNEKFIPEEYLYSDVGSRIDLLRGLMDTDGHVRPSDGHAEFSTTSRLLAHDVCELVRSLGGCTRVRDKAPGRYTYNGDSRLGLPSYRVTVTLNGINPFALERKAKVARLAKVQGQTRAIVSIEPADDCDCMCISVDAPDSLYVTEDYILTHNTVVFSTLAHEWDQGRVLILAHREELIFQAAEKVHAVSGEAPGIEMADERVDRQDRCKVVVSSVPTLCRERRLAKFDPGQFGLVVVDEAHHAVARSYRVILDHFRKNAAVKVLGVTATPKRADLLAMGQVFDSVAMEYGIEPASEDGWLVPVRQRVVKVDHLDFSQVRSTNNDLNETDLEAVVTKEESLHAVAAPTVELAGDLPTLAFCVTVEHARRLCEILNRYKPESARHVSGKTDKEERRKLIADYKSGRFQFFVNVGVFLEGFDAPTTACVCMARPTKSLALYTQVIGRGTRALPGVIDGLEEASPAARREAIAASPKPSMLVLDFAGNAGRHKLITAADLLGGKYSAAVREYARQTTEEEGKQVLVGDSLERAQAELALLEEERERAAAMAHIKAKAEFRSYGVSPFGGGEARTSDGFAPPKDPATEKQIRYLLYLGVEESLARTYSKRQAGAVIDRMVKKRNEHG